MLVVFAGDHVHKIEPRGRVSIPSDFRNELREQGIDQLFIVPKWQSQPCHGLLTPRGFDAYIRSFHGMDLSAAQQRAIDHKIIGRSRLLSIDDLGRIVVPPAFREMLGIESECVFVGSRTVIELWEPATLAALHAEEDDLADDVIADHRVTDLPL